ncbi:MAG: glutamate formimidoyltransferase [Thermoanaerobaculia bacterium]|nr:glutamate formimidoyltransferase [Thermoanaerobaculia bacterium]MBP9826222.1 glutamate formimidoyltransferase [Thermoanaerobaculia bacterium]
MRVVECVPNISEGRRPEVYEAVAKAAGAVAGVTVLDVDPGAETNRTVITFVGEPEAVLEGAFQLMVAALERIDMSTHQGAHSRIGAVDVVPFVPVSEVTMAECVELARRLAERVGRELAIPVYLYEQAATSPERRNLADIRAGEYEGLAGKLADPAWRPDFGPATFVARSGASVIGARPFLVAYNVNLNTVDKRLATRIAFDIREKGRKRLDAAGQPVRDAAGAEIWDPGLLAGIKAVGWTIPEFGCAQISINVTDLDATPLHVVFDTCEDRARAHGLRVTGSELVGLVPRAALLAAGRHFLARMGRSTGVPERALIHVAVRTLGLSEVKPFDPQKAIIEARLTALAEGAPLVAMTLADFADELSSDSPAPGGGSVAAYAGALAAGLATMVANLSHPKRGFEAKQPALERIAVRGQALKGSLLAAVDADTAAFDRYLAAMRMPKETAGERALRDAAMVVATIATIEVPLGTLEACPEIVKLCLEIGEIGLQASLSDAGTGAAMARAAASGAYQNVCINLPGLADRQAASRLLARADAAWARTRDLAAQAEAKFVDGLRQAAG